MTILQNNWCNYCFIRQAEAQFYIRHKNQNYNNCFIHETLSMSKLNSETQLLYKKYIYLMGYQSIYHNMRCSFFKLYYSIVHGAILLFIIIYYLKSHLINRWVFCRFRKI